jgi:hypothetical protein
MPHIVLLGDSIFDNAAYVPGELPVIEQLRARLPINWQTTLLAVDGDITADIDEQIRGLPEDATHLVISSGGNDALGQLRFLEVPTDTLMTALAQLAQMREAFQNDYREMLGQVCRLGRKVTVCTIYDAIPNLTNTLQTALCLYNDVILLEAARMGVPVIELRLICTESADYSTLSPIEPSAAGGKKIVAGIVDTCLHRLGA